MRQLFTTVLFVGLACVACKSSRVSAGPEPTHAEVTPTVDPPLGQTTITSAPLESRAEPSRGTEVADDTGGQISAPGGTEEITSTPSTSGGASSGATDMSGAQGAGTTSAPRTPPASDDKGDNVYIGPASGAPDLTGTAGGVTGAGGTSGVTGGGGMEGTTGGTIGGAPEHGGKDAGH